MIPAPLIYTGVASFGAGWTVLLQGRGYAAIALLAISVLAFGTQLHLDRRSRSEAAV